MFNKANLPTGWEGDCSKDTNPNKYRTSTTKLIKISPIKNPIEYFLNQLYLEKPIELILLFSIFETLKNTSKDIPKKLSNDDSSIKKSGLDENRGILLINEIKGIITIDPKIEPIFRNNKAKIIAQIKLGSFLELLALSTKVSFLIKIKNTS